MLSLIQLNGSRHALDEFYGDDENRADHLTTIDEQRMIATVLEILIDSHIEAIGEIERMKKGI